MKSDGIKTKMMGPINTTVDPHFGACFFFFIFLQFTFARWGALKELCDASWLAAKELLVLFEELWGCDTCQGIF